MHKQTLGSSFGSKFGSALALVATVVLPVTAITPAPALADPLIVKESKVGNFISSAPLSWGINDPNCVATSEVKEPVVLIHGTSVNAANWIEVAPVLKDAGMCVWAFDYGADDRTLQDAIPSVKGIADIEESAKEVAAQIDYVREVTGSQKVNLVGHSQGGLHTKTYQQLHGNPESVARVVTLAGNFHGTDLDGKLDKFQRPIEADSKVSTFLFSTAGLQQLASSDFMKKMNALPDTVAGVQYTSIYSPGDTTVTPNTASQLAAVPGADVVNMDIRQVCGVAPKHAKILKDKAAVSQVLWALTRDAGERPNPDSCAVNASPLASLPSSPALPTADLPALGSF